MFFQLRNFRGKSLDWIQPTPRWFFQRRGANFSQRISQWKNFSSLCNSRSLVSCRSRGTTAARSRRTISLTCNNIDRRRNMWLWLAADLSQITLRCDDVSRCDCILECDPRCFYSSSGLPTSIEEPVCFNRGGMVKIRPPDARRPPMRLLHWTVASLVVVDLALGLFTPPIHVSSFASTQFPVQSHHSPSQRPAHIKRSFPSLVSVHS